MATMTRIVSCVFGFFFLLLTVPMIIGGVAVLAVPAALSDNSGYMNSPSYHVQNADSYAVISQSFTLSTSNQDYSNHNNNVNVSYSFDDFGKIVNFRITADSYFIGLAPTSNIDQYLSNVSYTVVDQMNEHSFSTYTVNEGKNGSLSSPANQSFWLVSGINVLYYTPSSKDFNKDLTFVVMKVDASKGVDSEVQIGVNAPILKPIGIVLVIVGILFFIVTVTMFIVAYKSKDHAPRVETFPTYSPQQVLGTNEVKYYSTPVINSQEIPKTQLYKYCASCGTKVESHANFCEACGSSLNNK